MKSSIAALGLFAFACSSSANQGSADAFFVEPGNLFETVEDLPRHRCKDGSLASFDPSGRWSVERSDGKADLNASYFRDEQGALTALLELSPISSFEFSEDDLFARQVQGAAIKTLNLCAHPEEGQLLGYLGECLDGACSVTEVDASLVGPITE
jgi:hypothetical protein